VAVIQPAIDPDTLLQAGSELGAADRALLSLLCVHRLSEARIASLSGIGADRLRARRERVAALLEAALGQPREVVADALAALAAAAEACPAPGAQAAPAAGAQAAPAEGGNAGPAAGDQATAGAAGERAAGQVDAAAGRRGRRNPPAHRRRRLLGGAIAGLCIALGIVALEAERAHARPVALTRAASAQGLTAWGQKRDASPNATLPRGASAPASGQPARGGQ